MALAVVTNVKQPNFPEETAEKVQLFWEAVAVLFRASVFRFLASPVIRYARVKTGRLKAAWTPMMEAMQYDYSKYWKQGEEENSQAVAEGKAQGSFIYDEKGDPWKITIINSVEYASIVDEKYGVTELGPMMVLIPAYEKYFYDNYETLSKNVNKYFQEMEWPKTGDYDPPEAV
jgi:hypothetical protein